MAYKKPKPFVKVGDVTMVNYGQGIELQERLIDGELNPNHTPYRNASCRFYLKNGTPFRVFLEVAGVIDKDNPLATGQAVCGPLEQQPFYARLRAEKPTKDIPIAPIEETG